MQTSVELQKPLSFSWIPIAIFGLLTACCLGYFIYLYIRKKMEQRKKRVPKAPVVEVKRPASKNVMMIKQQYLAMLQQIQMDLQQGKISLRDAYQKMSSCIRGFVYEMTGVQVTNYTLEEIRPLRIPMLEALIAEYYKPEFEYKSEGDVMNAIGRTAQAIQVWR